MRNDCQQKYHDRGILPNALDISANIADRISKAYEIISYPIKKELELFATKTTKSICNTEGIENSELD